jgi:hypothetical protein
VIFYGEELLAPRPTPKVEDHPLLAVRNCLFNVFAATLYTEGRSSIRNVRTRHAVVTGPTEHLSPRLRQSVVALENYNPGAVGAIPGSPWFLGFYGKGRA